MPRRRSAVCKMPASTTVRQSNVSDRRRAPLGKSATTVPRWSTSSQDIWVRLKDNWNFVRRLAILSIIARERSALMRRPALTRRELRAGTASFEVRRPILSGCSSLPTMSTRRRSVRFSRKGICRTNTKGGCVRFSSRGQGERRRSDKTKERAVMKEEMRVKVADDNP